MKKVLLATSALVLTAGVASAEVAFSGNAEAGIVQTKAGSTAGVANLPNVDATVYSGIDFNVALSATADNGLAISTSFDMGTGEIADVADKELDTQSPLATADNAAVSIAYNGVTIGLGQNKFDDLYDDSQNGDVSVSGAFGGLSYALVTDLEAKNSTLAVREGTSVKLGYTMGDIALSYVSTTRNDNNEAASVISASYTMGAVKATVSHDDKGKSVKDVNELAIAYTAGAATITASATDGKVNGKSEFDLGVSYTAGAATFNVSTDESDAWEADVAYDLGGGVKAFAATDSNSTVLAGMNFAF
jgi:outer membrane protein OmpU